MKKLTKRVTEKAAMLDVRINAGKTKFIQVGKWDSVEAF